MKLVNQDIFKLTMKWLIWSMVNYIVLLKQHYEEIGILCYLVSTLSNLFAWLLERTSIVNWKMGLRWKIPHKPAALWSIWWYFTSSHWHNFVFIVGSQKTKKTLINTSNFYIHTHIQLLLQMLKHYREVSCNVKCKFVLWQFTCVFTSVTCVLQFNVTRKCKSLGMCSFFCWQ